MKRLFLLFCTSVCCLSGYASVTLFPSSTSITAPSGGGSVGITVIASGETNTATITSVSYLHNETSSPASNQFDANAISGANYHSPAGGPPTNFPFTITIAGGVTQTFNVTYHISTNVYNSVSGSTTNQDLTFTITINPYAPPTYWNVLKSGNFTRSNCTGGETGSTVTYTVAAHTYSSTISQADADQQAVSNVNATGPYYANATGTCAWWNVVESGTYTRNTCSGGQTPGTYTTTVPAHTYSSTISQADANNQAISYIASVGQGNANTYGTCSCATPSGLTYTLDAGSPGIYPGSNVSVTTSEHHIYITYTGPTTLFTPLTSTTTTPQDINIDPADSPVVTYNSATNTTTVAQEFYFTNFNHLSAAPITMTLKNGCGTSFTYTFSFHL